MNNDLFTNDQYRPEGALEIELRVREREKQLSMLASEDRLEEANLQPQKKTVRRLTPIEIFLNVF